MKESHIKEEDSSVFQLKPLWKEGFHNVWLASTLTLERNFAKFNFPQKLDKNRQQQIVNLVFEALKKCPELTSVKLFLAEHLAPLEKEFLLEHYLAIDGFLQAQAGQGFIVEDSGEFLALLNLQNHLRLVLVDTNQEIEKSWSRLIKIEESIGKSVDFAFNSRFGFLNAEPKKSGTSLEISLFLHIPAIIHTGELAELLEREKEEEITAFGLQGSPTEMIGDILVAKNSCTIGLTEEYILTAMRMWATRAVVSEVTLRKKIRENGDEHTKNKVARALGVLTHSYQLEAIEALNAISLVELGIDVGWIKASQALRFGELIFNTRRAHLLQKVGKKVEIQKLAHKRAEYLHEIAKSLTLVI